MTIEQLLQALNDPTPVEYPDAIIEAFRAIDWSRSVAERNIYTTQSGLVIFRDEGTGSWSVTSIDGVVAPAHSEAQSAILGVKAAIRDLLSADDVLYRPKLHVGAALMAQPGFVSREDDSRYWFSDGSRIFYSELIDAYMVGA